MSRIFLQLLRSQTPERSESKAGMAFLSDASRNWPEGKDAVGRAMFVIDNPGDLPTIIASSESVRQL